MSTPLGEKTLAAAPVPLDHLAANLDPCYEGLAGGVDGAGMRGLDADAGDEAVDWFRI